MTSKEWVKNELSLSDDCLTTFDRIMLNKVLQDLERLEQLEKENKELKKTLEIIKNKSVDMSTFGALETYKDYEHFYNMKFHLIENELDKLDEKEFGLIKEVLCDE